MLKHRLIVVAFTASLFPALASAADYGRPPLVVVSPWVGHYIGIAGGAGWHEFRWLADVFGGYNIATGTNMIIGVEADAALIDTGSAAVRTPWAAALRGRVGWATFNSMLYFAGGLAIGQIVGPGSRATDVGWTLGLGVEANMRPNVRGRIEYRYTNLGTVSFSSGQSDVLAGVSMTFR